MERQNNEIQLEFQMTKGELAEYCVNKKYGHRSW